MTSTMFEFAGHDATLENYTPKLGKKGQGGERVVGLQLRFCVVNLPLRCFAALVCADPAIASRAFWRIEELESIPDDQKVDRRFLGLETLNSPATYQNRHTLQVDDLPEIRVDKLTKFELTPTAGEMCTVSFNVTLSDPPDAILAGLAHRFRSKVMLSLMQDPELDLSKATSESDKKRKRRADKKTAAAGGTSESQAPLALEGEVIRALPNPEASKPKRGPRRLNGPAQEPPQDDGGSAGEDDGFTGGKRNP